MASNVTTGSQGDYPAPRQMRRKDGSARFAYATFVILNDSYVPGALVLAHSLKRMGTEADILCLVNAQISDGARAQLGVVFDRVIPVETIFTPYRNRQRNQFFPYLFTRFHVLRLGPGGGLGFAYEKIVMLDADMVALRHFDHLFSLDAPAGVLNESKDMMVPQGAMGEHAASPETLATGKWGWHARYEHVCPHGARIPKALTDQVLDDPDNMGVNGALIVLEPSLDAFRSIGDDLDMPEWKYRIHDAFHWPEMQYITAKWSGRWHNVDARFAAIKGYPSVDHAFGLHFAGFKPWKVKQSGTMARYARYDDFRLWFDLYDDMLAVYGKLARVPKLRKLREAIGQLRAKANRPGGSG